MKTGPVLAVFTFLTAIFPDRVHLLVPPKTPVLTGFEPAAVGSYRELVCDASQPGAGTITYKWYKYSTDRHGVENWEAKGPIVTSQKYVFSPVKETEYFFHEGREPVSGKYKCRASNSAGTRDSEWGDLYVYEPCSEYTVTVSPAKVTIGSTFTLNCYIPNPSGFAVYWLKKSDASSALYNIALANRKGCDAPSDPRYSWSSCSPPSFSSPTKTFNLQVTNAQTADSAYWMCQDIGLGCRSNPVKLIMQAPPGTPQITGFPSGPVTSGMQLNLKCVASPYGDTYDWYKYGRKVATSPSYDFQVTKESAGVYKCIARNIAGSTTSRSKTLEVYFNPSRITMTQRPPSSINEGKTFNIVCETDSANPVADIQFHRRRAGQTRWEKLTSGITTEIKNGLYNGKIRKSTLTMIANRLDNQARFECKVNEGSFHVEKTVRVNIYFPPTVTISSSPKPVKEGDMLTLTCSARGGNPNFYNYKWFYKNKEIPYKTSRYYRIRNIKYTESGTYRCQATNYPPDVKADGSLNIDILYKAKWNPEFPEILTVPRKTDTPMKFVLHVIANPPPTGVIWFFPNMTLTESSGAFTTAANDGTYTLSKRAVQINDYGNYTVEVTNTVGTSTFIFELQRAGPPHTPCCLRLVNATAVSLTLTFTSIFPGGSPQTFTIGKRTSGGNVWDIAVNGIADPGIGNNVTQKISSLKSDTNHKFRVKATNDDGDSGYGEILEAKTEAAPNVKLTVERRDNQVTVSWPKLLKVYTRIQIKFCQTDGGRCDYHDIANPANLKSTFTVKEDDTYTYSMIIFDGEDRVFVSAAVPAYRPLIAAIAGGVTGGIVFLLAAVLILKKTRGHQDTCMTRRSAVGGAAGLNGTCQTAVDNRAFESTAEPKPPKCEPGAREMYLADRDQVYVGAELGSSSARGDADPPNQTELSYVNWPLRVQGDAEPSSPSEPVYANWPARAQGASEPKRNYKPPKCEPGAREKYLADRDQVYVVTEFGSKKDAEEGASVEVNAEHPYEVLKITTDVISDHIYTKLRPWQLSHADCYKNDHEEAERADDG